MKKLLRIFLLLLITTGVLTCLGQSPIDPALQKKIDKACSPAFSDSQKMASLSELINNLLSLRDTGAFIAAERLLDLSRKTSSPEMTCKAYEFMGRSKTMRGKHRVGLDYFLAGIGVGEKFHLENQIAILSNNAGVNYVTLNKFDSALYYYHKSLAIYEKQNNPKDIARSIQNIAKVKGYTRSYREAIVLHSTALKTFQEIRDTTACIAGLILLAESYNGVSEFDSAQTFLNECEKLVLQFRDTSRMIDFYSVKGHSLKQAAKYEDAMDCYVKALSLSNATRNQKGIVDSYMNAGIIFGYTGNHDSAYKSFVKGLEIANKHGLKQEAAKLTMNVGASLYNTGNYTLAYSYYISALKLYKEINRQDLIGNVYTQLGLVQYQMKNYDEAIDYLKKGLEIRSATGNKLLIGESHINLSMVYLELGNIPESTLHDSLALKWYQEAKNKRGIALALSNKASNQLSANNFSSALALYKESQKISSEIPDQSGIIISSLGISNVLMKQQDYQGAKKELMILLNEPQKIDTPELKEIYLQLSEIEKKIASVSTDKLSEHESWKNAYYYLHHSKGIGDSLLNAENIRKVANLEFQYNFDLKQDSARTVYEHQLAMAELEKQRALSESEKRMLLESIRNQMELDAAEKKHLVAVSDKQKAILEANLKVSEKEAALLLVAKGRTEAEAETQKEKFLRNSIAGGSGLVILTALFSFVFYKRKRDAEQKQKETKLHLSVSEMEMKALRSQMNPHFVFNALQSIQTFLISNKSEDANYYLLKFSKLMRAVLENSLHSEVPLKDDMQALELYMQLESIRLKHPFTYSIHIDDDIDPETDTLPPLILQPFVENSIWHGLQYKTGPGHINIHISKENHTLKAVVEDNGIGRSMHNRVSKTNLLKKESLGMKLTEERLKVLNEVKKSSARFEIIDLFTTENLPSGTKVELSLPLVS